MARMYQISEADLCDLEQIMPRLADTLAQPGIDNKTKVRLRRVQRVLSDVRWNYGPPETVERIPVQED